MHRYILSLFEFLPPQLSQRTSLTFLHFTTAHTTRKVKYFRHVAYIYDILCQLPCGMCYFPSFWDSPHCTALQTALQYFLPVLKLSVTATAKPFIASPVCIEGFCQVTVVHVWCITTSSSGALQGPKHAAFFMEHGRIPSVPPSGASVT